MKIKSYNLPLLTYYKIGIVFISLFLSGFTGGGFDGEGSATITPTESFMQKKGEYTIKFVVGEHGIAVGGGIKTRFPKRWRPHIDNPAKNNYLKVNLSAKSSGYKVTIKRKDSSLDGQREGQAHIITLTVIKGPLVEGDSVSLTIFKKRIKYYPACTATLPVASDVDGDGDFSLIKNSPRFTIRAGDPEGIYVVAPTTQQIGKGFDLKVAILDEFLNAADYTGTIGFTSSDKKAILPKPYAFSKTEGGVKKFSVVLNTPGYHTITVSDKKRDWSKTSNPIDCRRSGLEEKIWWGDIHSHSEISGDGIGNGSFEYARDVAGLDFYSLTDHSGKGSNQGITDEEWKFTKQQTIEFDDPGKFVTILGYECSMSAPSGHHNIYFNCSNDIIPGIPLFRRSDVRNSIIILWQKLKQALTEKIDVITIPHHTGLKFREEGKGTQVNFDKPYQNQRMRVALEIISQHGTSEKYDPSSPFSYDNIWRSKNQPPRVHFPVNGPHYAQDAWAKKRYLGVIASSDDHTAHPGIAMRNTIHNPLAAVYAKELTRDAIFNAIKARRTYATTNQRIILNFTLNSYPMGSKVELKKGKKPKLSIVARGTDLIDFVEILKWDFIAGKYDSDGHPIYEAVLHKKINAMDVKLEFVDDNFNNDSLYYLRLKQLHTITDNEAWAWSSPIWVSYEN